MEEDLGVKKVIMVEKQEDRFDFRSLFININYLKVFIWRNFLLTFEVDLIIFPTIYYGPKSDKKWSSKLALEDILKEPCGQKNPNRKFGKKGKTWFLSLQAYLCDKDLFSGF